MPSPINKVGALAVSARTIATFCSACEESVSVIPSNFARYVTSDFKFQKQRYIILLNWCELELND